MALKAIESPGVVGEMFTSASSFDPSFWPLHGAMERLLSFKRARLSLGDTTVGDFDESWTYPDWSNSVMQSAAYLNGRCDWSRVKGVDDLTLPVCNFGENYFFSYFILLKFISMCSLTRRCDFIDGFCTGHNENDALEFTDLLGKGETYTNREMYELIHPWNSELPYVYDSLDFDYCATNGYEF